MQPRKRLRRFHEPGQLHELTFSCYGRRPLLTSDRRLPLFSRVLQAACELEEIDLVAFVYMPEHVHLLVNPRRSAPEIGRFLAREKQPYSQQVKTLLKTERPELIQQLTVPERAGKSCFRFWQSGSGFDRNIVTDEALRSAIDYIHCNPVKRGLCARAIDWKWSSARYYLLDPPRQQFPELPFVHGLRERGLVAAAEESRSGWL